MKVLFASRRPAYPFFLGGAERSFYELARALSEAGHRVAMIGECQPALRALDGFFAAAGCEDPRWDEESVEVAGRRVPVRLRLLLRMPGRLDIVHTFLPDFRTLVNDVVRSFDPDVICTQLEGSAEVVEFCASARARVLHFVRDSYHPFNFHVLRGAPGGRRPAACIANSAYTAQLLQDELGVETEILYPIVRRNEPETGHTAEPAELGRRILFCNPDPRKGGDLMYEVARELGELTFVVLPGWATEVPDRWRRLPNVEAHAWPVLDVERAYAAADVVVVPSQQDEGFGRVAIEAQAYGTPVIAARHSGLEEVLGDSAVLVDDFRSPQAWASAIRRTLADRDHRRALALAGKANAARFEPSRVRARFEEIVACLADRDAEMRP